MKNSKLILVLVLILALSCKNDDDSPRTPITISPEITIDIGAIIDIAPAVPDFDNPVNITALVNFGQPVGVSSADYLVEMRLNDTFTLDIPSNGLGPNDKLWYDYEIWYDEFDEPLNLLTVYTYIDDTYPSDAVLIDHPDFPPGVVGLSDRIRFINIAADDSDLNWKYDIICFIESDGVFYGPYVIDPKIKIKSTSSQ
ncbi:MAG: hypothetical protein HKN00_06610 [Flavobacteriaceae bacterium]|nr:hypothetical protein [Bacteroidia bacterium]NNF74837.1 hypothetical protein [Flavobacteriaceae bacterium]NNK73544.1 hypothetical protein [Flavobacteriaceae bacterium]